MNKIDYEFSLLIDKIKEKSYEELLGMIKLNFLSLPETYQRTLEEYFDRYKFWGSLDHKKGDFNEIEKKTKMLKTHYKDIMWLYNKLADFSSKFILLAVMRNYLYYDFVSLEKAIDKKYKHYFDLDLLPSLCGLTIVDVGAYTGDSILDFVDTYGAKSYKKAYCYEITLEVLEQMKDNLSGFKNIIYKNKAVKSKNGRVFLDGNGDPSSNRTARSGIFTLESVSLDEDIKEKIDLIKMDIEGDELSALKGAKNHIKEDSPVLLISIYHKNEHLWQIAKFISSVNKNYKYFLRYYGGNLYPTELVLFAIKK